MPQVATAPPGKCVPIINLFSEGNPSIHVQARVKRHNTCLYLILTEVIDPEQYVHKLSILQ
jgi:hypothetical protein